MEKQERKTYGKEKSQKMMSFRVDNGLLKWLATIPNKGRLINELLWKERTRRYKASDPMWEDPDEPERTIHDYEP